MRSKEWGQSSLSKPSLRQNYATKLTLMGVFLTFFTAFSSHYVEKNKSCQQNFTIKPFDLLLLALATLRLGRLVSYDKVFEPIRAYFTETVPDDSGAGETVKPRGKGARQSLGQLITCPICSGTWIASGLVYGLRLLPSPTRIFISIMSTMGLVELLDALLEDMSWTGQAARKAAGSKERRYQ